MTPKTPPLSRRTAWSRELNAWSTKVAELRARGASIIDLTESNPTAVLPPPVAAEIALALSEASNLHYRPAPFGEDAARAQVRDYYRRRDLDLQLEDVALVCGTSEAYGHLLRLVADPGDEVLVPSPSYPLLEHLAALADVKLVPYSLAYDGSWHLPSQNLEPLLTKRTRAMVVISPNNPTGSYFDDRERSQVVEFAAHHGLALISDEVFADFLEVPEDYARASLVGESRCLCFSLNGLSKSAGLPQMKAGWIVVSGPAAAREESLARLELVLDAHLSISNPAQAVLRRVLPRVDGWQAALRRRLEKNRAQLDRGLEGTTARRQNGAGSWSAIVELPDLRTDEAWAALLLQDHGILGQPGYFFDLNARPCLVLSLILPEETFAEGVRRLALGVRAGSS